MVNNGREVKNIELRREKKGFLAEVFLPKGFPESVSEDYVAYQIWDSAQALCSSVTGALSANSVFKGIGVGDEGASALSATTNWILRQGLGKVASIGFAYRSGATMGSDSKRFRLLADIVNDLALSINLSSAFMPAPWRPFIYAASSVCWAIVGIAGSCTRTALTIHQARANNAADVQAKDQSQETLVELAGLVLSYVIVSVIGNSPRLVVSLFCLFIILHLVCNYRAVKSVKQTTLNLTRMRLLVSTFKKTGQIPDIVTLNNLEPVIVPLRGSCRITVGAKFVQGGEILDLSENVVMCVLPGELRICLGESFTPDEVLKATMAAVLIESGETREKVPFLLKEMQSKGYSFSTDHIVIEKYRVRFD